MENANLDYMKINLINRIHSLMFKGWLFKGHMIKLDKLLLDVGDCANLSDLIDIRRKVLRYSKR